nr:hypothetical protein [Tanacetum cinerariifolium]
MFPRFVQLLIDHQLGVMSHHKDIYDNPSLTKKVFANMKRVGTGFSGVVTLLFDIMLVPAADLKLKELMDLCTHLSNKVLELESEVIDLKSTYKERIKKLEGRVDRLEEGNRNLKDLHNVYSKVDIAAPVDVDNEEPADVEEVLEVAKAAKLMTKVVTTSGATTTARPTTTAEVTKVNVPRRRRGVVIQDPEETTSTVIVHLEVQSKDKGKGMTYSEIRPLFEKHYNYSQAFLEELNKEVTIPEKEVEVEGHKREGESLEKVITKKQKMDEEAEELKSHLQIVTNDDDDVYTEATPLASKIPIVDYKIYFERNKPYFKIIRSDELTTMNTRSQNPISRICILMTLKTCTCFIFKASSTIYLDLTKLTCSTQSTCGLETLLSENVWKTCNSTLRAIRQSSTSHNRIRMLLYKEDYTIVSKPRAIIYKDRNDQKKMMRETEVHKFSDVTLTRILERLGHMVKDFMLFKYNLGMEKRIWSKDDRRRSKEFMEVIERRLKIRIIFRSLESFVSGRLRDVDYRLIQRTE